MTRNFFPQRQKYSSQRAQAIVEFAIVLPILLVLLVGILEVGRLIFMYAAVNNASREAVRYASAVGVNDAGTVVKYNDCDGIRARARRSAFFVPLTITISHDTGPSTTSTAYCSGSTGSLSISSGDRVTVEVKAHYKPMVNLIPISQRDLTSITSRTVLGILKLNAPSGGSGGSGGGGSSTNTPTVTATATVPGSTAAPTNTPTRTATPAFSYTLTPQPTATITLLPSSTPTFTPTYTPTITLTPTQTLTPTATYTPTSTSTPVATCAITAGGLTMSTSSSLITMTLTNPYIDVTVSSVRLQWNALTGAPPSSNLTWTAAILAGTSWSVNNTSGDYTSPTSVVLPGYNVTSTLTIAFNKIYKNQIPNGTTVTVNFADPTVCNSITMTK